MHRTPKLLFSCISPQNGNSRRPLSRKFAPRAIFSSLLVKGCNFVAKDREWQAGESSVSPSFECFIEYRDPQKPSRASATRMVLRSLLAFRGIRSYADQNCHFQAGTHYGGSPAPAHRQPKRRDQQCRHSDNQQSFIHFFLVFRFLKRRASARQLS